MALTFWSSSHYKTCLIDPEYGFSSHRLDDIKIIGESQYTKLMIFFANFIQNLGSNVLRSKEKLNMQIIATAIVYFRRFYAKRSVKEIDPFLMAPTCLYLACKAEEFGYLPSDRLVMRANVLLRKYPFLSKDIIINMNLIQEAEFYLLEIMDCSLIVFHPYRSFKTIIKDVIEYFEDSDDENPFANDKEGWNKLFAQTTRVMNDSYRTDLCLKYPPHQIALGCMLIALLNFKKESYFENYFNACLTDKESIENVVSEILSVYDLWENFDEKEELPEIFKKVPRPS
uniref:Cyclin-C n=1 Tax=Parastrongyloides trichosuri TaxID=131310 RepID=A0A0N5A3I9_PARTI